MASRSRAEPTPPKGRPTPSQGAQQTRTAAAERRSALLQWSLVLGVLLAIGIVLIVVLGDGPALGPGGTVSPRRNGG